MVGSLITFEGMDGSGKTTQIHMLEHEFNTLGVKYKTFREPGGTELSEKIRTILLDKENIEVVTIPGPSAVTAALSISGIPTDHFYFEGFLPPKKGRKTRFELLECLPATVVIFESPQRVIRTLKDIHNYWGNRIISVCRELTKMHEETLLGTVMDAEIYFSKSKPKGEFVLLVAKKGYTLD